MGHLQTDHSHKLSDLLSLLSAASTFILSSTCLCYKINIFQSEIKIPDQEIRIPE